MGIQLLLNLKGELKSMKEYEPLEFYIPDMNETSYSTV